MNYYLTSAEKLVIERSKLEGKLEGWQAGWMGAWNEGMQKGQYELTYFLVQYKFGSGAATFYGEKIKKATAIEIQELCKKIITCQKVESVFE